MGMRGVGEPYAGSTQMVDKLIGNAFPIVREVADNLMYINEVRNKLVEIISVSNKLNNIDLIESNLPNLTLLVSNLESILAVGANADNIGTVVTMRPTLQSIVTNLDYIVTVAARIVAITNVNEKLNAISTLNDNILAVTGLYQNIIAIVELHSKMDELLAIKLPEIATASEVRGLKNDIAFVTPRGLGDAYAFTNVTIDTNTVLDLALSRNKQITLTQNTVLAEPINPIGGLTGLIVIKQDATGSRTLTFNSFWNFGDLAAPTITSAANTVHYIQYTVLPELNKAICTYKKGQ